MTTQISDDAIRAGIRAFQSGHNGHDDLSDWRAFVQAALAFSGSSAPQAQPLSDFEVAKILARLPAPPTKNHGEGLHDWAMSVVRELHAASGGQPLSEDERKENDRG